MWIIKIRKYERYNRIWNETQNILSALLLIINDF